MPKTTKRSESRRAAKIARAHSTQLPDLGTNSPERRRTDAGYKAPARGIARYPWASIIILCLVVAGIFLVLYVNHYPPFAQAKNSTPAKPAATATPKAATTPASTPASVVKSVVNDAASVCAKPGMVSAVTKTGAPSADDVKKINHTYSGAQNVIDNNKVYCAGINTNRGLIVLELDPKIAPKTVNNFVFLAQNHFYDGLTFHRVLKSPIAIAQGGDPEGTGSGGPGYKFADEPVKGSYTAGTVAMANSGPNTNGSQFFIDTGDNSSQLGKQYNLFGHVVDGLNVAQALTPVENGSATPDVMNYVVVKAAS
ncbi:peptidylprolyl isomerase [Dictyobacter aurantiacus]|nr:peptidylprolyl isomerase [Dictyobacter aurantiacus]